MTIETDNDIENNEGPQIINQPAQFDARRLGELLERLAACTVGYTDLGEALGVMDSLVERTPPGMSQTDCETLQNRLRVGLNSFLYVLRIGSGWKDETVDMDAASRIVDKIASSTGFGVLLFSTEDILDLESFASKLREPPGSDGVSLYLADRFSVATKDLLRAYKRGPDAALQQALADELNRIIRGKPLLSILRGKGVAINWPPEHPDQASLIPQGHTTIGQNRLLLEDVYPLELARRHGTKTLRPLTDEEVWLLGKRGANSEADNLLSAAFSWIINDSQYEPKLTQRQMASLVESVWQQAIVYPTRKTARKAWFVDWAELPGFGLQARLAEAISNYALQWSAIKPNLAMTPEERAAEAQHIEEICCRANKPENLTDHECWFLIHHRPSSLAMAHRMAAAVPLFTDAWFVVQKRALASRLPAPEDPGSTSATEPPAQPH